MVKMISVSNDTYSKLKKIKRNDESFSSLFNRLMSSGKHDILEFFGTIPELDETKLNAEINRKRNKNYHRDL